VGLPPASDAAALGDALIDAALAVYTRAGNNDYFLLHGVTAAWALRQLLPHLPPPRRRAAAHTLLCALLGAFVVQGSPPLSPPPPVCGVGARAALDAEARALLGAAELHNEHVYKLAQVVTLRCDEAAGAGGAADELLALGVAAVRLSVAVPLSGRGGEGALAVSLTDALARTPT